MNKTETTGLWLSPRGWVYGKCVHDHHVHEIEGNIYAPGQTAGVDATEPFQVSSPLSGEHRQKDPVVNASLFIPAPVDLHVHGGGGADVMQGDEALRTVLGTHAMHGTGALLATSVTAPFSDIDGFLQSVGRVMANPPKSAAHLLGAHLEGPFINPDKLGAQPDFPAPLNLDQLESWFDTGHVKVITYAPELDPDCRVPPLCAQYSVKAQLGHTLCSWAQATQALSAGVGVTHLYNAMSPVLHRGGGAAVAALAYASHAEIITDGIHVDKAAFDAARRAIPGLYSVTDATAAAGMPDGPYSLGNITVTKSGNRVSLPDGTLAGSCLTQLRSITLLRQWGLDWVSIASLVSAIPAAWLQTIEYGRIDTGSTANWLEIDVHGELALWLNGQRTARLSIT